MLVFKLYQQYEYDMNKKLKFLKNYGFYILEPLKVYEYKTQLEEARYENDELHSEYLDMAYKNNQLKNDIDYFYKNEVDNINDLATCEISLRIWCALAIASFIVNIGLLALIFIK